MFTGIVKEIGTVEKILRANSLIKLGVKAPLIAQTSEKSDSISVNGVCLTLIYKEKDLLFFEAVASTLKSTNTSRLKKGDRINLEPALNLGDKLGGHFVLGHVDAELKLKTAIKKRSYWQLSVDLPSAFRKYIADNGSVALEGISLTVKKVFPKMFQTHIIPFTYEHTTLKLKRPGNFLNVEFDYLLKKSKL